MVRIIIHDYIESGNHIIRVDCERRVDMYSLKTESWKSIQDVPDCCSSFEEQGVFVNRSSYWAAFPNIIGFDLKNENFRQFPWPRDVGPMVPYVRKIVLPST